MSAAPRLTSLLVATAVLSGCVARPTPPLAPPPPRPFIVTFWCGPPLPELTDARAAEIAAAGFTVIGAPCEGPRDSALNHAALDVAARHGLKVWITDPRVDQYFDLHPEWAALLDDAVRDYAAHPALDGYFLVDEPSADKFEQLRLVVGRLRQSDPQRVPYVNLLPDFVAPESFGTPTYREHVEQYIAVVRPTLLSFDYYPFRTDGDRPSYFDNLALIREQALRAGIPFIAIVQAMPHGPYRDPTEAELAWQVNHALAFGARGISYFTYWTPVHVEGAERWKFRRGLVEHGKPTARLAEAARLNADARAIAAGLDGWRSLAVVDSQGRFGDPPAATPVTSFSGGPLTIGWFGAPDGGIAALVVNQDYRAPARVGLVLASGTALPELLDTASGTWRRSSEGTIVLSPGGAALLRWPASGPGHTAGRGRRRRAGAHRRSLPARLTGRFALPDDRCTFGPVAAARTLR